MASATIGRTTHSRHRSSSLTATAARTIQRWSVSATNLTVLSGDDSLTLPMMSVGAEGVISVAGNIVPRDIIAMVQLALAGDFVNARTWHHKLFPLCRDMLSLATNPIPLKAAMKMLGRDTGELRLPMTPLDNNQFEQLGGTLKTYGLISS